MFIFQVIVAAICGALMLLAMLNVRERCKMARWNLLINLVLLSLLTLAGTFDQIIHWPRHRTEPPPRAEAPMTRPVPTATLTYADSKA